MVLRPGGRGRVGRRRTFTLLRATPPGWPLTFVRIMCAWDDLESGAAVATSMVCVAGSVAVGAGAVGATWALGNGMGGGTFVRAAAPGVPGDGGSRTAVPCSASTSSQHRHHI